MHQLYGEVNMATFKIGKMLMSSLFKKPSTRAYPAVEGKYTEMTRGHIEIDADKCILCGMCSKKCPADAITVDKTERKWIIDRMSCVQCQACVESCPKECLIVRTENDAATTEKTIDLVMIPEKPKE